MKTIFVLMDSMNRHYLPVYGNKWVKTSNIDRLVKKSIVFNNHWLGSAPCMPARRDIMTGRLNFLERDWGGLEPYDINFPRTLKKNGIFTHIITDHYHYFHPGGENFHAVFNTWDYIRGQEHDKYVSSVKQPEEPEHLGAWSPHYTLNKTRFKEAKDYPSPMCMQAAVDWLRQNKDEDDYFLWVEVFDPHEPFDCPKKYVDMYDDDWDGPLYNWSGYEKVDGQSKATKHLQKQYAGTLTMVDEWFGKLLDEIESQNGYEDTMIILTSDHGHMLGGHNCTGKSFFHTWNEMAHIPLIIHLPGNKNAGEKRDQITQNIDMMPTILDYYNIPFTHPVHGKSLKDVIENNGPEVREGAIYGWFGQTVNVTDGKYTYLRTSKSEDNQPLNIYFQNPSGYAYHSIRGEELLDRAELGYFLPHVKSKVLKCPVEKKRLETLNKTFLFNISEDYGQTKDLSGTEIEKKYINLLEKIMESAGSPEEQFIRMGLK